jgi:Flp pilus assembly protein TadB
MFLRKLLLVLVAYLIIRFIYGIYKFRGVVKKTMKEMHNMQNQQAPKREGEVHISTKKNAPSTSKDDGTYVDFEEVD